MAFNLPPSLHSGDDEAALGRLRTYYASRAEGRVFYSGSRFDGWDSSGSREDDCDVFTADDLVAVTFLSVRVSGTAAIRLLDTDRERFTKLLRAVGSDRDLAEEHDPLSSDFAGWALLRELRGLPQVGLTTASKLLARKRPRLRPIYDTIVAATTGTRAAMWEPMRVALRADNGALHRRLLQLRDAAALPTSVSALRVLDVVAWMDGKARLEAAEQDGDDRRTASNEQLLEPVDEAVVDG